MAKMASIFLELCTLLLYVSSNRFVCPPVITATAFECKNEFHYTVYAHK